MNLGWSAGGRGELRAADADRDEVRRLLDVAREEGRLDEAEYGSRAGSLATAKTRGDLVRLTANLPERKGVRAWADGLRVRAADREDARGRRGEAATQGRLADHEYQQRLVALSTVATYDELTLLLDGIPGWSGTPSKDALAGTADRDEAMAALTDAVADGRVRPVEAPAMEATIRQARRRRDVDDLLVSLAKRASDQERQHTVEALTAAHQAGQLDATEYTARVYVYFTVHHTIVGVVVSWLAVIAIVAAGRGLRVFAGPVDKRQEAALDALRGASADSVRNIVRSRRSKSSTRSGSCRPGRTASTNSTR